MCVCVCVCVCQLLFDQGFCVSLCCRAGKREAAPGHPGRASIQRLRYCLSVSLFVCLSLCCTLFVYYLFIVCVSAGPHCPLLPLPANSRYRRSSEEVQDMISYPMLLPKTSSSSSSSSSSFLGHAASSSVAMVSSLHPAKMNCSRIFNLFCLYGNVEKVCAVPQRDGSYVAVKRRKPCDAICHLSITWKSPPRNKNQIFCVYR